MDREPDLNLKSILLISNTIPNKALEAGKALVSAFFPLVRSKVLTGPTPTVMHELLNGQAQSSQNGEITGAEPLMNGEAFAVIEVEFFIKEFRLRARWLEKGSGSRNLEPGSLPGHGMREVDGNPGSDRQDGTGKLDWDGEESSEKPGLNGLESLKASELPEEEIREILELPLPGKEPVLNIIFKRGLLKLLTLLTNKELPWGILNGIRPAKLVHVMADRGIPEQVQEAVLEKTYAVRPDKVRLLREVGAAQAEYLKEIKAHPEQVGLYISIPFCPSRCSYCSFPGYALGKERGELKEYLDSLRQEIRAAGELMSEMELWGSSLYLGGGTPSILSGGELGELLEFCRFRLPLRKDLELTVEAGRPDTLSEEKLGLLAASGVSRLSINPQTMQNPTLQRIGRAHTVERIEEIYRAARRIGGWVINMDLILGLPGEGLAEVESTLEQLAVLRPDNLTVHALALKKGSRELELGYQHSEQTPSEEMQKLAEKKARSWGLKPYYLYRQKRIAGNLENIGYAYPGTECLYNIAIMEERQSIIGLGAGATTKIVNPLDYTLKNLPHVSNWKVYLRSWPELQAKRVIELNKIRGDKSIR